MNSPLPMDRPKRQMSVSELPEHQQERAMSSAEMASELYPSELIEGVRLHVCFHDGGWEVWLNCEDADFTGLCVAADDDREEAVAQAVSTLEAVLKALRRPVGA